MVNFINRQMQKHESKSVTLEVKETAARYTTNNITKWVLGVDYENFADEPSELFKATKDLLGLSLIQNLSFFVVMFFPALRPFVCAR